MRFSRNLQQRLHFTLNVHISLVFAFGNRCEIPDNKGVKEDTQQHPRKTEEYLRPRLRSNLPIPDSSDGLGGPVHSVGVLHARCLVLQPFASDPGIGTEFGEFGGEKPKTRKNVRQNQCCKDKRYKPTNSRSHLKTLRQNIKNLLDFLVVPRHTNDLKQPEDLHHTVEAWQSHQPQQLIVRAEVLLFIDAQLFLLFHVWHECLF